MKYWPSVKLKIKACCLALAKNKEEKTNRPHLTDSIKTPNSKGL